MHIDLTPEQERLLQDEINSGEYRNPEDVITEALRALHEKRQQSREQPLNGAQSDAVREMLRFAEANRTSLKDVTVKDLIREGHRT